MRGTVLFVAICTLAILAQLTWGLGPPFAPGYDATEAVLYPVWNFIHDGVFPVHGGLNSMFGYNPPGHVWLHILPMWLTRRLSWITMMPAVCLHSIALALLYAFARKHFGPRAAIYSVILYAFSTLGLYYGHTRWLYAYPPLFVILFYLFAQWALEGKEWHFAALLPATAFASNLQWGGIILWPVLFLLMILFKKKPRLGPALLGSILALAIVFPFLRFEFARGFKDLKIALGSPAGVPQPGELSPICAEPAPEGPPAETLKSRIKGRLADHPVAYAIVRFSYHYAGTLPDFVLIPEVNFTWDSVYYRIPSFKERVLVPYQAAVFLYGLALLAMRLRKNGGATPAERLVFWSVVVTAAVQQLTGFTAHRKPYVSALFYGPQMVMLSYALTSPLWSRTRAARVVIAAILSVLILTECVDAGKRVVTAQRNRIPAEGIRIVDLIAQDLNRQGRSTVSIRFDLLKDRLDLCWMVSAAAIERRYSIGAPYNFLLEYRHGIRNTQITPDGWAPDPDYIVLRPQAVQRYDLASGRYRLLDPSLPTLLAVVRP